MGMNRFFACSLAALLPVAGCDNRPASAHPGASLETLETMRVGTHVDDYVANPTADNAQNVDRAFAALNREIAELRQRIARGDKTHEVVTKVRELEAFRDQERLRFAEVVSAPHR